ncbi:MULTISPECIES: hypothetical protein [Clostridium]|uniref:Phage holin n=1 Tax=Clostridium lapidicellarium TaxID=3240931 RepID=A0ABV4DY80_9CLOT
MNNVYIISGVAVVVILLFVFGYLRYKKIDITGLFDMALKIVGGVEQLYLSGQLSAADRKNTAIKGLTDFLASKGIKVSDTLVNVISLIVEWAVKESDSADINKLIDAKIAPIQKKLDATTKENTELKANISTLQNKLSTVQSAVAPAVVKDTTTPQK